MAIDSARVGSAISRARRNGWIPTLSVRGRRGQGRDLALVDTETGTELSTDDELMIEASLVFRFHRLLFAPEEVALLREERRVADERVALARAVASLYYERRKLLEEEAIACRTNRDRALRIAELEAVLNAMTGGLFARRSSASSGMQSEE